MFVVKDLKTSAQSPTTGSFDLVFGQEATKYWINHHDGSVTFETPEGDTEYLQLANENCTPPKQGCDMIVVENSSGNTIDSIRQPSNS